MKIPCNGCGKELNRPASQVLPYKEHFCNACKFTLERRFWRRVEFGNGCWNWTGARTPVGYGTFHRNGANLYTHRVSYEMCIGTVPNGLCVLHKCDNPRCVNPAHLFLGTKKDNTEDARKKGRMAVGEKLPQAKLTASTVLKIREIYAKGGVTQQALADRFGVEQQCIHKIVHRLRWTHI